MTLAQLVDTGRVTPPLEIFHRYKGVDLRATIDAPDRVLYAGDVYDSLSTAAGMARKSVVGDKPGRPYPQTNGWTFWEYRAADGSRRQLDALRSELFANKVVPIKEGLKTG